MRRRSAGFTLRAGFTLVELLVVIGIIALLIAILLPALNKARQQAVLVQCQSNMRQLGIAFAMYQTSFNGYVCPVLVWGTAAKPPQGSQAGQTGGYYDDEWPVILSALGYVPNQNLNQFSPPIAATSILVCPAVRDFMCLDEWISTTTNTSTNSGGINITDGFDRRISTFIQPGLTVDSAYGINGAVYTGTYGNGGVGCNPATTGSGLGAPPITISNSPVGSASVSYSYVPMFDLPCGVLSTNEASGQNPTQMHNVGEFRRSADTVLLYDGTEWNGMIGKEWRISGARHGGNYNASLTRGSLVVNGYNVSGTTNLLFMDGHVENAPRVQLPAYDWEWYGSRALMDSRMNRQYVWNKSQQ